MNDAALSTIHNLSTLHHPHITMTAPLTPQTPSPILGSPVSLSSASTLVNVDPNSNGVVLPKAPLTPATASLVLEKLQEILE